MLECFSYGMYWRGLTHDLSKLRPSEFFPYARHFYGDIKKGRDGSGYYKPTDTGDPAFDHAWFLHQKRNSHHWQYWCLPEDESGHKVLEMPIDDLCEMLSDWRGAGRAQGTPDTCKWYNANGHKLQLHPVSRGIIETALFGNTVTEGLGEEIRELTTPKELTAP